MRERLRAIRWDWALFGVAVAAACCCLHIGLSGKYSDDYAITMRDLATGEIDWSLHPWATRYPYFWRPLHLALLWGVGTVFWNHDWVAHTLSALAHCGCALVLAIWLRRLGLSVRVSVMGGLVFMTNTLHAEAINWFSTICVSLGALTMLWVLEMGRGVAASGAKASWGRVGAMAGVSFAAACWYESSAAGLLALPLVMVAARPGGERPAAGVRRAAVPTAACGLACVLYAALLVGTAPAWQRGSSARMAGAAEFMGRSRWIVEQWGEWLAGKRGRDLWVGAWIEGAGWLASPAGVVVGAVLVAAGVGAMWAWAREGRPDEAGGAHARPKVRLGWLALAGASIFVGAWVPIVAVRDNSVELRTWYAPLVGLVVIAACGLEGVMRVLERRPRGAWRGAEGAVGLGVICVVLAGALAHMGWQHVFVRVWQRDELRAAAIVAAAPNPAKDTVIMPLATRGREASTGRRYFDLAVEGGLAQSWSSWAMMQRAYKRRDITATHLSARTPEDRPLSGFSERGVWSKVNLAGDFERSERGCFVAWERAVPVELGTEGHVEFVSSLRVLRPRSEDLKVEVNVDRYRTFVLREGRITRSRFRDPDSDWGRRLTSWMERASDGAAKPIKIEKPRSAWPVFRIVAEREQGQRAVWIDLPPSTKWRIATLRCVDLEPSPITKGCGETEYRVRTALSGTSNIPVASSWQDVFRGAAHEQRYEVTIPPSAEATRLWCELYMARKGEFYCDGSVTLDPGWLIDVPDASSPPPRGVPTSPGENGEYTPPTPRPASDAPEDETE